MEPRDLAIAQARGRIAVGLAFLVSPSLAGRLWVGGEARRAGARVLGRAFGVRDLALGLGVMIALDRGAPVRGWLEASALSDAGDFTAGLLDAGALPPLLRPGVLALGAGSSALAAWLARELDSEGRPLPGTTPEAAATGHPGS
ncbi:MAG TPA: hypothetical protein VHG69_13855 [Thermoleophilaceae bacterium]|nr:hypothetical protein [Thermoleophilaceae bacterium]